MENEINEIKQTGGGRMAQMLRPKENIIGNKKAGQELTVIRHHETEELVVSSKEIRKTT